MEMRKSKGEAVYPHGQNLSTVEIETNLVKDGAHEGSRVKRRLRGQSLGAGVEIFLQPIADCMGVHAKLDIHANIDIHAKRYPYKGRIRIKMAPT